MELQKQISSTTIEIENGFDFILNHLDQNRLFPRTIMTKKLGYQKEVFSKEEALQFFKESDFIDCRINAFPSYTEYKGIQRYPPDLIFIDIDKNNFQNNLSFDNALSITLRNIKKKLGDKTIPTVLKSGGGYHIILPISCPIPFENIIEFNKFDKPSEQFLRFSKDFLSNGKADKNNNPSFKSCLLRIPGSINFKYNRKVAIVQKWNSYRSNLSLELLLDFKRYLTQQYRQKQQLLLNSVRRNRIRSNNYDHNYYKWIEHLLQTPIEDCRKLVLWKILCPYLINVKKLSFNESTQILREWLDKCNLVRRLDFNPNQKIKDNLKHVGKFYPIGIQKLKTDPNYKKMDLLLFEKDKKINYENYGESSIKYNYDNYKEVPNYDINPQNHNMRK